ncbi:MAG: PfkB family carbohydrate kinase [Candidatus Saccharicenans sp.]
MSLPAPGRKKLLFSKAKIIYAKPPKINFKSSIGCGDAFLAGFLYKFKRGKSYEECLKFAVATGTAKAEEEGTKMPSLTKVKKIYQFVKIYQNIENFNFK